MKKFLLSKVQQAQALAVAAAVALCAFFGNAAHAALPDNGVDEQTLLTDLATEWGPILATILGFAFAFSIAYLVFRRMRGKL